MFMIALSIFLGVTAAFLGKEHLKKFAAFKKYADLLPDDRVTRLYCAGRPKPGMIIIRLASAQPFTSLIAFELAWRPKLFGGRGVDPYGYVYGLQCQSGHYEAYATVYMRYDACTFVFAHTGAARITAEIVPPELENDCLIQERLTPHWFRRLGF